MSLKNVATALGSAFICKFLCLYSDGALTRLLAPDYSLSKLAQKVQYSTMVPLL